VRAASGNNVAVERGRFLTPQQKRIKSLEAKEKKLATAIYKPSAQTAGLANSIPTTNRKCL
jgi:hypothetical protein